MLRKKSIINAKAAEHLQNTYCCSSIHCSYYSCVQLAKYILINKLDKKKEINKKENFTSFHRYYIDTIFEHLKSKQEIFIALDFRSTILELKTLREDADYEEAIIGNDESKKAIEKATTVKNILNTFFGV